MRLFAGDGEKVRMDGNSLPSMDGMFRVRENFNCSEML